MADEEDEVPENLYIKPEQHLLLEIILLLLEVGDYDNMVPIE